MKKQTRSISYNPFTLEGKNILVTGTAGGIGQVTAIECSKMGANVIVTDRNEECLKETLLQLEGDGHQMIVADLGVQEDIEALAEELSKSIRVSARGGDMYARYSNNQFIVLLLGIAQEDCVLVQARINDNLSKESRKRYIKYHVAPVNLASAGTDQDTAELNDMIQGE